MNDVLQRVSENRSLGIVFVSSATNESFLSYADIYAAALRTLGHLQASGLGEGHELIFQIEDVRTFVIMFWACLLGKILPIPINPGTRRETLLKVLLVWRVLHRPFLAAEKRIWDALLQVDFPDEHRGTLAEVRERRIDVEAAIAGQSPGVPVPRSADDLAYIQFSSGATGDPRGVMLTHANIWYTTGDIVSAAEAQPPDKLLSWLPLTHDMGLIGGHLMGIRAGIIEVLMPPSLFVRRPLLWMEKASCHRVQILVSPNFGYHYFLSALDRKKYDWDLSSLKHIFNGAEQISERISAEFLAALAPYGMGRAMKPCYGLAEASLAVTLTKVRDDYSVYYVHRHFLNKGDTVVFLADGSAPEAATLVDVGPPVASNQLRIVDGADREVEDGSVGSIQAKGGNVSQGYYNNPEATRALFTEDGWLRTGDLGFKRNGRLVVTGREKEIIILGGQNYYPADIEGLLHDFGLSEPGKAASVGARTATSQGETLVVFLQTRLALAEFLPVARQVKDVLLAQVALSTVYVIPVPKIPKTTSGKLQRTKLVRQFEEGLFDDVIRELETLDSATSRPSAFSIGGLDEARRNILEFILAESRFLLQRDDIDPATPLTDQGMDSQRGVELLTRLARSLRFKLSASILFEYPTAQTMANYLARTVCGEPLAAGAPKKEAAASTGEPVAIIGLGCRFPGGAHSPEQFWRILNDRVDTVRRVPEERWDADRLYDPDPAAPGKMYCREGSFLDAIDEFDPEFFGIAPKAAVYQDPQQRLLLEVSWEALEFAGQNIDRLRGSNTGVFIGMGNVDYAHLTVHDLAHINQYSMVGILNSVASGRLSYFFGFHGPSMTLDTACSSSLVAVHQACESLRAGACDLAIAGGVNAMLIPQASVALCKIQALSPDGRCKPFDAGADGYGRGEGCGMVVLKRLSDANRDRDSVLAVIRGSAVNQDGRTNGLTAPNGLAQRAVIRRALEIASVKPDEIGFVEAHGTGTLLGDPVELQAVGEVYNANRAPDAPLFVGSVKSNIGHLESAAGIASLIKVALALHRKEIPPNLHFEKPSPQIPWHSLRIRIPTKTIPWTPIAGKRRAGLSAFGISGTNAHAIIEEAPELTRSEPVDRKMSLLTLSARTESALKQYAQRYADVLPLAGSQLHDMIGTTNASKVGFEHRLAVVGADATELVRALACFVDDKKAVGVMHERRERPERPELVFQFTGQGSQSIGMGMELYRTSSIFRHWMDRCDRTIRQSSGRSILASIMDRAGDGSIHQTLNTQPAVFAIDYALCQMFKTYGIEPDAVLGHSVGEFVAACVAGVLDLDDALRLVCRRAELMSSLPEGGGMMSILAAEQAVIPYCGRNVAIAAVNGPEQTVISGESRALAQIAHRCNAAGIVAIPLAVSHAFHSPLMDPILDDFAAAVREVELHAPRLPLISNVTGKAVDAAEITKLDYWVSQLRHGVRFYDSLRYLHQLGFGVFVECGPAATLSGLGEKSGVPGARWVPSLRPRTGEWRSFLQALGTLFTIGVDLRWDAESEFYSGKVPVPTYPFQRQKYWVEVDRPQLMHVEQQPSQAGEAEVITIGWQAVEPAAASQSGTGNGTIVFFSNPTQPCNLWTGHLRQAGWNIVEVQQSALDPQQPVQFQKLIESLSTANSRDLRHVIYNWSGPPQISLAGLLHVVQAIDTLSLSPRLTVLVQPAHAGEDAPIIGFVKTIGRELPRFQVACLECASKEDPATVALLDNQLFAETRPVWMKIQGGMLLSPVANISLRGTSEKRTIAKPDAAYLITGGFGVLGLQAADWLVRQGARHIVLMGRGGRKSGGELWIERWRKAQVTCLEMACDVANGDQLKAAFQEIRASAPPLKGVIHCAGVLNDATIANLTWSEMRKTLAPKADGAWNLHRETLGLDLDFFVMFSSLASLLGNPGQANYAAANASLDGLAHYRRSLRLPGVSVCWGAWAAGGMGNENRLLDRLLERFGVRRFASGAAFEALERILGLDTAQVAVAAFDRGRLDSAALTELLRGGIPGAQAQRPSEADREFSRKLRQKIQEATPDAGRRMTLEFLSNESRSILGIGESASAPMHGSFFEVGFDSLMITQLRNAVSQRLLDAQLPISTLFAYNSIAALADHLHDAFLAPKLSIEVAVRLDNGNGEELLSVSSDLLEEVLRLSDDEIEKLL